MQYGNVLTEHVRNSRLFVKTMSVHDSASPGKHLSPIDSLLTRFKLWELRMEVITPVMENAGQIPCFKTSIPASREQSIEEEDQDKSDFKVFSDGSGQEGGAGAAAVIYRKGRSRPLGHLKAYLGPLASHSTYEGEAVGGLLGCYLIQNTPGMNFKTVSLYINNQAIIKASVRPKASSGQYLVQALTNMANNLSAKVTLWWISSHSEVKGNEHADELAKEAALGRVSSRADLPPLLRKKLPTSASAIKQEHTEELKRHWHSLWLDSPRQQRFELVDDDFPFTSFRKWQDKLSRRQATLLMQVCSGHIPLNSFLFKIGKSDSKSCPACQVGAVEAPAETVTHFLFHCSTFTAQRYTLARAVDRGNLCLKEIMLDTKCMIALTKYIGETGRFSNKNRA